MHLRPVPPISKPGFSELLENGKHLRQVSTDFLKVDLETALTFTGIALGSDNAVKKDRNRRSARKAYDTVLRLMNKLDVDERDVQLLRTNLERLRSELQMLGEAL